MIGSFNITDYLNKLYEEVDGSPKSSEGLIIPEENKKTYAWLKKEYQRAHTEVKVEMKLGNEKFNPGYEMQTKLDSIKEFKPGMFGDVKTEDTEKPIKKEEIKDKETKSKDKKEKKTKKPSIKNVLKK